MRIISGLLVFVFLAALGWRFAAGLGSRGEAAPKSKTLVARVDRSAIRGEARPLRLRRTGFAYKCSECHETFHRSRRQASLVAEHEDHELKHGTNDYCLNCHHPTNRDAYVAHDGAVIPADQPARLCAKCYGPVWRDWRAGAHGRRDGYWDVTQGKRKTLLCIQCHDPHNPTFPALTPMPAPGTERANDWEEH